MPNPAIILVNTQLPENIGAAARAMMNFGLGELRLVHPREEWPNKRAYDLAGHAAQVLDEAKLFNTTSEAVADLQRVYATTARSREIVKPIFTPVQAVSRMHKAKGNAAILFGPERTGLTNDDVALCDAIISIPTATELSSINIAQSVVVVAYQWFQGAGKAGTGKRTTGKMASPVESKTIPATKAELQNFLSRLERDLDAIDFWKTADKKPKMWLNLRNIFSRAELTDQEVRTLHGVIAGLKAGR